ncbi:hypothetical protein ACFW08_37270 [Streptomyces sp. NPDC058960]|uniref:hypothetical protein n=1 Tax=Streptomyces sp. NPDC058960 TaxID=3346679 RepID=UPI0036C6CECA
MSSQQGPLLTVHSALVLLIGVLIGGLVGVLTYLDGNSPFASVLAGAVAAGAAVPVLHKLIG